MILYLIRHGETDWNAERRCQGFSDRPLNETGRRQAEATAARLSEIEVEAVYSSSLVRASELGQAVANYHDLPVQTIDALKELNQGDFEGLALSDLVEKHSAFLQRWFLDPADVRVPGGESMRELQTRAWAAIEEIVARHDSGAVVVVAHNLCNTALLCHIMQLDLTHFRRIRQDEAAINVVEFGGRWPHPVVLSLNDTCHLG